MANDTLFVDVPAGATGPVKVITAGGTSEALDIRVYDPTDVFGDIADAIAEGWPEVAPEFDDGTEDDDGERDGSA